MEGQWGGSVGDIGDVHLINPAAPDCPILGKASCSAVLLFYIPRSPVKLHIFKDALAISEPQFGVMPIANKDIQSLLYYNGDGVSYVVGGGGGIGEAGMERKREKVENTGWKEVE